MGEYARCGIRGCPAKGLTRTAAAMAGIEHVHPMTPAVPDPTVEALSEAERIAAGRIRHGVGSSEDFPGNVCHLVSPIVGILRLRQHHGDPVPAEDVEWWIDRLSLVLDMARAEAARAAAPDALRVRVEALAAEFGECWVTRSEVRCTGFIGGTFNNGGEWVEAMCCLPCRLRALLEETQ